MIAQHESQFADIPSAWSSLAAAVTAAAVPPFLLIGFVPGAGTSLLWGAGAWALALLFKLALSRIASINTRWRTRVGAASWGLFSALSELGVSAILFSHLLTDLTILQVVAFGVGASSIEIVYVLSLGISAHLRGVDADELSRWAEGARKSLWVRNMLGIERVSAVIAHVAARGLIYLGLVNGIWLIAVALATFTTVDGCAVYGRANKWNWFDPVVARRFQGAVLAISSGEFMLFLWIASRMHY